MSEEKTSEVLVDAAVDAAGSITETAETTGEAIASSIETVGDAIANSTPAITESVLSNVDKMTTALGKAFDGVLSFCQDSAQWLEGEIPIFITELLHWRLAHHIMYAAFGIAIAIVGVKAFKKLVLPMWKDDSDWMDSGEGFFGALVFGGIVVGLIMGGSWAAFKQVYLIVQVTVAPRIYLIEYISELIKKSQASG